MALNWSRLNLVVDILLALGRGCISFGDVPPTARSETWEAPLAQKQPPPKGLVNEGVHDRRIQEGHDRRVQGVDQKVVHGPGYSS